MTRPGRAAVIWSRPVRRFRAIRGSSPVNRMSRPRSAPACSIAIL